MPSGPPADLALSLLKVVKTAWVVNVTEESLAEERGVSIGREPSSAVNAELKKSEKKIGFGLRVSSKATISFTEKTNISYGI